MQKKSDIKNFISLMLWTFMPSVYLLIRMNIVSVNHVDINILGQMEWFDLIDEIITTAFITPLYYLLKEKESKKNGFSFVLSFGVYCLFTILLSIYWQYIGIYECRICRKISFDAVGIDVDCVYRNICHFNLSDL